MFQGQTGSASMREEILSLGENDELLGGKVLQGLECTSTTDLIPSMHLALFTPSKQLGELSQDSTDRQNSLLSGSE